MKHVGIILCGWLIWLLLWVVIILPTISKNEIIEKENKINGSYTSSDMISVDDSSLFEAQNINISFFDGNYTVEYDIYSKCTQYYTETRVCYDNQKKFIEHVSAEGTYTLNDDDTLTLNISSGAVRECKLKDNYSDGYNIDCTSSGGWLYKRD